MAHKYKSTPAYRNRQAQLPALTLAPNSLQAFGVGSLWGLVMSLFSFRSVLRIAIVAFAAVMISQLITGCVTPGSGLWRYPL